MLVRNKDISVSGDLGGEKVAMSVDEKSLIHLMSILSDIYSDVKVAIVRELSTNAIDSHIKVGQTCPIEIYTPTALSPKLVIQDFGEGMNADDIRNIYSKYGASTKRDSDDFNGTLGIGAKSPLAYGGKTFTVVGIKDGIQTSVVVGYDPSAGGTMEIIDECETDKPNGVKITVPVNDRYDHAAFEEAAMQFADYATFPVKVNGKRPEVKGRWLTDKIRVIPQSGWRGNSPDMVVMGNVAYRIDTKEGYPFIDDNYRVIFYVEMGEVDFTPSREDLNYSNHTKATIERLVQGYLKSRIDDYQSQIDKAKTRTEAFYLKNTYAHTFRREYRNLLNFTYKGDPIPDNFLLEGRRVSATPRQGSTLWSLDTESRREFQPRHRNYGAPFKRTIVLNYTNKTITKLHVEKVKVYCEETKLAFEQNIIFSDQHNERLLQWFDEDIIIDWDKVKEIKVKLPQAPRKKKEEKPWEGTGGDYAGILDDFVPDKSKNIYYTSKTEFNAGRRYFDDAEFRKLGSKDDQIFLVIESLQEKFLKLYPNAKPINDLYVKQIEEYFSNLTIEHRVALEKYSRYDQISLPVSDPNLVLDPELREACAGSNSEKLYEERDRIRYIINKLPYNERPKYQNRLPAAGTKVTDLRNRYPLLPRWFNGKTLEAEHALIYVNAVYQARKGAK